MNKRLLLFLILIFLIAPMAQVSRIQAEEISTSAVLEQRKKLEQELAGMEAEIESYRGVIQDKQQQAATFERDISVLEAKIKQKKLEIKANDLQITQLNQDIKLQAQTIGALEDKISREKDSISELIRKTNEVDSYSIVELILGYDNLSGFFVDPDSYAILQKKLNDSIAAVKDVKSQAETEKDKMEDQKAEQVAVKLSQEMERQRMAQLNLEKSNILKKTKGEEKQYQKFLAAKEKDAAAIRSQLFLLSGSTAIPFEKAVEYATVAWKQTGVRPAFLLGLITEESNLGANVGKGNWNVDLVHAKCAKQRTAFVAITSQLGLNPDAMPVSKKQWYGYCGGAMGPAQFMPTTWQLYQDKVGDLTGHNPPNPWDPQDAFMASALLLRDNGASAGGYQAERTAALKYLAGVNWKKKAYGFYGDDVLEFASRYQEQIDIINKN